MAVPDVSKFVGCCKDFLHSEWSIFKNSGVAKPCLVCIYSIGGANDVPSACMNSVGNGFKELESVLRETLTLSVDLNTPIVSKDVMVWADGQISLYPERKLASVAQETKSTIPPIPAGPGRRPKPPLTPEVSCMGGIEQVANYMLDHLKRMSETCALSSNIKVLYYVLASALLVKCRVATYKQVLKTPTSKEYTSAMNRCSEIIEIMTQNILNYHSDLIRSAILHDAGSHDWQSDKSYEEGEKVSLCIQMWCFHMQGIHNDLWRFTSPKIGENMFNNIFTDTLGLLVTRYLKVNPSDMRQSQMRGDITAIFFIVASFLPSLTPSPHHLFRGSIHDSIVFSIHRRMELLLRVAALKCAPIEALAKVFNEGIHASRQFSADAREPTKVSSCPAWLSFFNASLFPPGTRHLASLPDSVAVYLTLNNAALRPFPDQKLILRGLFMRDFLATKLLLEALPDLPGEVSRGQVCGGVLCLGHLCTHPLIPHTVYAAIVKLLVESFNSPQLLNTVMKDGIKDSGNWDSLDRKQVWNIQRPPWHHALVQLVGAHIAPVIAQILQSVPAEPPAQPAHPSQLSVRLEHHLSAWTAQMINGVANVADNLPHALVQIAHTVNSFLPPTIKPVGGHVISQLVVSSLYSMVNSRSSLDQLSPSVGGITDGQWDMMIAIGERLCSLHDGNYDAALQQMTNTLLRPLTASEEDEDERLDDYTNEEAVEEVCRQMADGVMASAQGQHAFGVVWEYLKRNMEWVAHALQTPPLLPPAPPSDESTVKTSLAPRMSFSPLPHIYNPLKYHDRIFFNKLNHENLVGFQGKWETVLEDDLWMPKKMIRDIVRERPEMQEEAVLDPSQTTAVEKLQSLLQ